MGLPYVTSAQMRERGSNSALNLRTTLDFADRKGEEGQKIPILCGRYILKPSKGHFF